MVSQNHPDTLDEKELEKKKEKFMKLILNLPLSKMCLHSRNQLPFEITTANILIPRVMVTNIIVCPVFDIDLRMPQHDDYWHDTSTRVNDPRTHDMSLHKAASNGDITGAQEAVRNRRELLRLFKPEQGDLPLHTAVVNGHKEVAIYLVNAYPYGSYALNNLGISPLYYAVQRKDLDLVEKMFCKLDKDDENVFRNLDKGKSIVRVAIDDNNQEMLETIVKYQPELIKCIDEERLTPLSFAASKGLVGIASYILQKYPKSIKSRNKDKTKSYPVHKAALGGHVEVLKIFYSKVPDSLLCRDNNGQTILHVAAKERGNKLKNVVSYLLSLKEGEKLIKIKDENEKYPLDFAKKSRNLEVEEIIKLSMPH